MADMSTSYSFSYQFATKFLYGMANDLIVRKYSVISEFRQNEHSEMSFVKYVDRSKAVFPEEMYGQLGLKELLDHQDGPQNGTKFVRDIDFVWMAKHIAHEAQHMYQMRELYQKSELFEDDLDMARMDAVASVFDGYHWDTYGYRLSEIDADIYGFKDAVTYLDTHLVDGNGKPLLDSKACLVEKVHELKAWRGDKNAPDYESMLQSLEDAKGRYRTSARLDVLSIVDRKVYPREKIYKRWEKRLDSGPKVGVARDRMLMSMSMDVSLRFVDLHPALENEARLVRQMYPSRAGILEKTARRMERGNRVYDADVMREAMKTANRVRGNVSKSEDDYTFG